MERPSNRQVLLEEEIYMPEASIGTCRNVNNCRQFNVDLANGHCVFCWDRGITTKVGRIAERKVKKDISKLTNGRKSKPTHIQAGPNSWFL